MQAPPSGIGPTTSCRAETTTGPRQGAVTEKLQYASWMCNKHGPFQDTPDGVDIIPSGGQFILSMENLVSPHFLHIREI